MSRALHIIMRDAHAKMIAAILDEVAEKHGEDFQRAIADGMISGLAAHLTKTYGPQEAFEVFTRVAEECARPILERG